MQGLCSAMVETQYLTCVCGHDKEKKAGATALLLDGPGMVYQYTPVTCIVSFQNKLPFSQEVRFRQHSRLGRVRKR